MFHQISEIFLTTSWWLYNKALINQLFVPYLSFLYEPRVFPSGGDSGDPP